MKSGLYLIGTPIGNLDDISQRAIDALKSVDVIFAEDTRHTSRLLQRYAISKQTISCHKFNEASRVHLVLRYIKEGKAVALVTNAGMPAISDPGSRIVRACRKEGLFITAVPGPSAVTMALALSGMVDNGYHFIGFLPAGTSARQKALRKIIDYEKPSVIFESPYRILKLMEELKTIAPDREIFIGRELTKLNEECIYGTISEVANLLSQRENTKKLKGEFVLVITGTS